MRLFGIAGDTERDPVRWVQALTTIVKRYPVSDDRGLHLSAGLSHAAFAVRVCLEVGPARLMPDAVIATLGRCPSALHITPRCLSLTGWTVSLTPTYESGARRG